MYIRLVTRIHFIYVTFSKCHKTYHFISIHVDEQPLQSYTIFLIWDLLRSLRLDSLILWQQQNSEFTYMLPLISPSSGLMRY